MEFEKVSIIIPVYKVESYLDKCVKTAVQQTYPNIEVLLIDDGSPDDCGKMCDDWAKKDSRIVVIHQENGGLADARNTGIEAATGEYLVFVDSDDYIAPDMVQKLYDALKTNDAEMSICNFLHVDERGLPVPELEHVRPITDEVISGLEVLEKMHVQTKERWFGWYYSMAWNKLYKRDLFTEIRYPKGKLCEDVFIAHKLFGICSKVACISDVCYYYVRREGSITFKRSCKTYLNDAEGYLDRAQYCYTKGLYKAAAHAYWYTAILLSDARPSKEDPEDLQNEYDDLLQSFRQLNRCQEACSPKESLQISIISRSPALYHILFRNPLRRSIKRAIWKIKK